MEPGYIVAKSILKPWLHVWFRWSIEGLDNIPKDGPAILAFNHIAYLDPLAAAYVVDVAGRKVRFLAKSELFQDKRIGWIFRSARQIEVKRGSKDAPMALDEAFAALDRGDLIVIFPEGTITNDPDLRPMAPKSGLARIALGSGAPVIPCAVWGTANIWGKGYQKHWRPRQDIAVAIGEPRVYEGDPDSPGEWERVGGEVMDELARLVARLRPIVPDRRRPKKAA